MPEQITALLATVSNPFVHVRVDNAWAPVFDVPEINATAFEGCLTLIGTVRERAESHGVLLHGSPGTGKTHMLSRLRDRLVRTEQAWFIYVLPFTAPDRFYRHVLHAIAEDVLRATEASGGVTQLAVAVARQAMNDPTASADRVGAWWKETRSAHSDAHALFEFLQTALAALRETVDADVVDVALRFVAGIERPTARAWLLGRSITEEQAQRLGVARTLDDEEPAENAIRALLSLAGPRCPVVLAFDQIEGLQRLPDDVQLLQALGHGVAQLFGRNRNVAAITCCQTAFMETLRQAAGRANYEGRLAEQSHKLMSLEASQAFRLIEQRLSSSTSIQAVRFLGRGRGHAQFDDPLWPLSRPALQVHLVNPQPARDLLTLCRGMFDTAASQAPTPPAKNVASALREAWESALEEERQMARDRLDEGIYVDGLLRACDLWGENVRATRGGARDIDLVLERGERKAAVAVCHADNMKTLAARLRRLRDVHTHFDSLVVVRDQRLGIPTTARRTREHLDALVAAGGALLKPSAEAFAALAALRRLLSEAAAGDLAVGGRSVSTEELKTWLARNAPPALRDLVREVAGEPLAREDASIEPVLEALREMWVIDLATLASRVSMPTEKIRELTLSAPDLLGFVRGPDDVVFLRPDAMERT